MAGHSDLSKMQPTDLYELNELLDICKSNAKKNYASILLSLNQNVVLNFFYICVCYFGCHKVYIKTFPQNTVSRNI